MLAHIPAHQVNSIDVAREVLETALRMLHQVQRWGNQPGWPDPIARTRLGMALYARYPVDPRAWWGPVHAVPPECVELTDLPWPAEANAANGDSVVTEPQI